MEDKERPEKRRKLEGDKRDGVLAVPSRSPRVVLNKIKLKEDVLERLRKIKRIAQAQVKENFLSIVEGPKKEVEEAKTEQFQENSAKVENKSLSQKRKREDDNEDGKREEQNLSVTKVVKVNFEFVSNEARGTSQSDDKEDADGIVSQEQSVINLSEEDNNKKEDQSPLLHDEGYMPNSEEKSVSIATPNQGDEVAKAAQNYAKSGAQTEPQQDKLVTDEKLVMVVTEVLEEGDIRLRGESTVTEHEVHVDNNNHGEKKETLSDDGGVEGADDPMSNAIYQLIKDVVKNRTACFESALLRENEKLEERVQALEKENALLQRVGCRLDHALKEITRKKQEAIRSRISRGTQVNINLHLSRTSTSKSTPIEIDIPDKANVKTSSPQPNSNSAVVNGKNPTLLPPSKTAIVSKTTKDKAASPSTSSSSSTASKPDTNHPIKTQPGKSKSSSEVMSATQSEESAKKGSKAQQYEQQDSSSHKKLQQGMGHFRLSPSYKRAAQQQMSTDDTIETGHFLITPTGLEQQSISSCQRRGGCSANEPSQGPSKPSSSTKVQKMDTSVPLSSSSQSNSNSCTLVVSSSTSTRGQALSLAKTQEERSHSVPYPSVATSNVAGNDLEKRSQSSGTLRVPTPSSPLSKAVTQEKRNLSAPPSLINTKTTRGVEPKHKFQTLDTSTLVTGSRASPYTKQPPRTSSIESIDSSQRREKSTVDEEPDIVIVSPTAIISPKGPSKKDSRNEKVGSQAAASGPRVQNNKEEQAQVRIQRVENHSARQEGPLSSDRQMAEVTRTKQHVQQHPQNVNQPSSNQQIVYRKHSIVRVSTTPQPNVPPLRCNEPQQHVRYVMRDDGTCLQVIHEQPRQADKGDHAPRQPPRYGIQEARGQQPQVIREQALHQTDKGPTPVRYEPKQPSRYIIQEGPPHRVHEGPRQPLQGVPQQQALPPGAVLIHQQHVSTAGPRPVGPRPPPIGIQDVRTQSQQPFATQQAQQAQQHITVKQHLPVQNPQHPHQYQHATYQYQQPPPRPTMPQQQTVPRTQSAVYYPPPAMQQVVPRANNHPTGYQPRPAVLPQEYVASPRTHPENAMVKSMAPVGGHVNVRQPPPDVLYQPGTLEGSTVRPPAPMQNHSGFHARPAYVQQVRQQPINNQAIPRPMVEQSNPRPSNHGAARYVVQQQKQQHVQERRTLGEIPSEKAQQPSAGIGKDAATRPLSPPKPTASIAIVENGIVLSWNITTGESTENIECYELFACQDDSNSTLPPIMWKKIGVVKALPLPMACTLTQFSSGSRYQFAVRAVDTSERAGPFSDPCVITLKR